MTALNPAFIGVKEIKTLQQAKPSRFIVLKRLFNALTEVISPFPITVTSISDNGDYADAASLEIRKRILDINAILSILTGRKAPEVLYHDIPSQDWRAGAFDIAQITRDTVRGAGNIVFLNCAPRLKQRGVDKNNKGESVYVGIHRNGTVISAVSEDSFALFRDLVEQGDLEIYKANVQIKGSQFRSRDFFTWFSQLLAFNLGAQRGKWKAGLSVAERRALLAKCDFIDTAQKLAPEDIRDLKKESWILRADCHGNLKLSLREAGVPAEQRNIPVAIRIRDRTIEAVIRDGMFDTQGGAIGIAPGSSGNWPDSAEGRFLEIALIGASLRDEWNITAQQLKEGVGVEILGPASDADAPLPSSIVRALERPALNS